MLYLALLLIIASGAYLFHAVRKLKYLDRELSSSQARNTRLLAFEDTCTLLASSASIGNRISLIEALLDGAKSLAGSQTAAVLLFEDNGFYSSLKPDDTPLEDPAEPAEELERLARGAGSKAPLILDSPILKNTLIVPLLLKNEHLGKLLVAKKPRPYTEEDAEFLTSLGTQAALALKKMSSESALEGLAIKDSLTGLLNHRAFQEKLDSELDRARRFSHPLSLLITDIDDFKKFNSAYGHESGDGALKKIARMISESIRGIDFAARYGGEEFAVLLVESSPENALKTAERIRECVLSGDFEGGRLTVSIGLAAYPAQARDKEELLREADGALYVAKKRGKNRVMSADKLSITT